MEKMLQGKIALVTGAARGIGRCIAVKLAEYGADVTLEVLVPEEEEKGLKEEITEGTSGRTVYQEEKAVLYAILSDGTPLIEELPQ